ncbi:MAG: iron(II)-dependent oxidoreductase EgtB, partial [Frankiales bacterium]|nr:iron(II)-dependent oxidoreductase EgtB [Frankiales bacterium]
MREAVARGLVQARERLLALTDFDEPELLCQHSPLMSPLVWDLAHVGQQEEFWLLRDGDPERPGALPPEVDRLYDAFQFARAERVSLPLLSPTEARSFLLDVRAHILKRLAEAEELVPFAMVEQHEEQHIETILATHQLRTGPPLLGSGAPLPGGRLVPHDAILIAGGPFQLGVDADAEPWSLDNERPAHLVDLPAFRIGRVPVTNAEWQAFIDADGYGQSRWWSTRGWQHRLDAGLQRPLFWSEDGQRRRFGLVEDIPPDEPVQHVGYFEAEAYAAWAGARLPTEQEWEKACAWDPGTGRRRRWPWGDDAPTTASANLEGRALRPAPVGAYPEGASAYGVEQLIGDVWEWTSSSFQPWPGFSPMIYDTY